MSWRNNEWSKLAGRKVEAFEVSAHKEDATLRLDGGLVARLELDGYCCSHSYFADPEQFSELVGATIQSVEERDEKSRADMPDEDAEHFVDGVRWHFLVFVTDRGHVTVDWRNDSNGYYDGDIALRVEESKP